MLLLISFEAAGFQKNFIHSYLLLIPKYVHIRLEVTLPEAAKAHTVIVRFKRYA